MTNKLKTALMAFAFLVGSISLAAAQDYRYYDRDDHRYYDRDDYNYYDRGSYGYDGYDRGDFYRGMKVARTIGYEDGESQAREDMWRAKPFNPYPRGGNHSDRGYTRDFGSRQQYRQQYAQAYQQGYSRAFHRNRYNW
jgi:hypothetical protein